MLRGGKRLADAFAARCLDLASETPDLAFRLPELTVSILERLLKALAARLPPLDLGWIRSGELQGLKRGRGGRICGLARSHIRSQCGETGGALGIRTEGHVLRDGFAGELEFGLDAAAFPDGRFKGVLVLGTCLVHIGAARFERGAFLG